MFAYLGLGVTGFRLFGAQRFECPGIWGCGSGVQRPSAFGASRVWLSRVQGVGPCGLGFRGLGVHGF